MKLMIVLGFLFVVSIGFAQSAETTSPAPAPANEVSVQPNQEKNSSTYTMCKSGSSVRTLRIEQKGQTCRAIYTKEGVDQILGRSTRSADGCFEMTTKLQTVLEKANWACRDISQTRVSTSAD